MGFAGLDELRERVRAVRPRHYSHLLSLLRSCNLEGVCLSTLQRSSQLLQWSDEPLVYLMVGFFSPDGFVIPVGDRRVIGIGLERYKSFRNLPIILAHECCHYMQQAHPHQSERCTLGEAMLREGICIAFSRMVVPERPLNEHLGMSRGRLNWLRANESPIWQAIEPNLSLTGRKAIQQYIYGTARGVNSTRSGLYIGFRMAEETLNSQPGCDMKTLLEAGLEKALEAYSNNEQMDA